MNLVDTFQNLVAQVPELVQPLIVALAAAVPFIEGEGAAVIGVIGGIHPVVAAIAAIVGNFACVTLLVLLGAGARQAIVARRAARVGAEGSAPDVPEESTRGQARREKFQNALTRYGVPGVSLLGPLLLPTHFTATMLAAAGVGKVRVLLWQAVAIVGWTTALTLVITGAFTVLR